MKCFKIIMPFAFSFCTFIIYGQEEAKLPKKEKPEIVNENAVNVKTGESEEVKEGEEKVTFESPEPQIKRNPRINREERKEKIVIESPEPISY